MEVGAASKLPTRDTPPILEAEMEKWGPIIKGAGIKAE